MVRFILIFFLIGATFITEAQAPQDLLGKMFNDREVQDFIEDLKNPEESILPYAKTYKLTSWESGVELEFNAYMVLFKVNLYDSGYSFKPYTAKLPWSLKWRMDSTEVQKITDYLVFNQKNHFVKTYLAKDYEADLYFRNNELELIKMVVDTAVLMRNSQAASQDFGFRLYPTGKAISGNVLDGKGVMEWEGGRARYEGDWLYGVPHGKGKYTDSMGNYYEGDFKLGFFWGKGTFQSKAYQYAYSGDYIMGYRHGQGEILYDNGSGYLGSWFKDQMDGFGTYRLTESYYYKGQMRANTFNGNGILYTKDGYIKGSFKDGKPHGYCEQYATQTGQTLKGKWVNGKKEGEFIMNAFGQDRKMYFKNDIEIVDPEKSN